MRRQEYALRHTEYANLQHSSQPSRPGVRTVEDRATEPLATNDALKRRGRLVQSYCGQHGSALVVPVHESHCARSRVLLTSTWSELYPRQQNLHGALVLRPFCCSGHGSRCGGVIWKQDGRNDGLEMARSAGYHARRFDPPGHSFSCSRIASSLLS